MRKFDINSLYSCPPHLYTVATLPWEIQKKSFSTILLLFFGTQCISHFLLDITNTMINIHVSKTQTNCRSAIESSSLLSKQTIIDLNTVNAVSHMIQHPSNIQNHTCKLIADSFKATKCFKKNSCDKYSTLSSE